MDLRLDPTRLLPRVDPSGREAHLACGAALLNLKLALHGAGAATAVTTCPYDDQPDLLARIVVGGDASETDEERDLRLAIPLRSTHRADFDTAEIPEGIVVALLSQVANEGALACVVETEQRAALAELEARARTELWNDGAFRREVARWTASNARRPDGVPASAYGQVGWRTEFEPLLLRLGYPPQGPDSLDRSAVTDAPLLVVLGAPDDHPESWLRPGAGMQRLLLAACNNGISASFLNSALHTREGRTALGRLVELDHPQVVLRLGYGRPAQVTARRSPERFPRSLMS